MDRVKFSDFESIAKGMSEILGKEIYAIAVMHYIFFSTTNDTIACQHNSIYQTNSTLEGYRKAQAFLQGMYYMKETK